MRVVCNHFGITLRLLSSTEAAHRTWIWSRSMKMGNITTTTNQQSSHFSNHHQKASLRSPYLPMHRKVPLSDEGVEAHQTTLWTHRSSDPWDLHHKFFLHCSTSTTISVSLSDNLHVLLLRTQVPDPFFRSKPRLRSQCRRTVCAAQSD